MTFLTFFAVGYYVCVVSICAGYVLTVVASYKGQHYDPKPDRTEYDAEVNLLPPKKVYDMEMKLNLKKKNWLLNPKPP